MRLERIHRRDTTAGSDQLNEVAQRYVPSELLKALKSLMQPQIAPQLRESIVGLEKGIVLGVRVGELTAQGSPARITFFLRAEDFTTIPAPVLSITLVPFSPDEANEEPEDLPILQELVISGFMGEYNPSNGELTGLGQRNTTLRFSASDIEGRYALTITDANEGNIELARDVNEFFAVEDALWPLWESASEHRETWDTSEAEIRAELVPLTAPEPIAEERVFEAQIVEIIKGRRYEISARPFEPTQPPPWDELMNGAKLKPLARRILAFRFQSNHTLEQTAKEFKITRDRIRQIENGAFHKIARYLRETGKLPK